MKADEEGALGGWAQSTKCELGGEGVLGADVSREKTALLLQLLLDTLILLPLPFLTRLPPPQRHQPTRAARGRLSCARTPSARLPRPPRIPSHMTPTGHHMHLQITLRARP